MLLLSLIASHGRGFQSHSIFHKPGNSLLISTAKKIHVALPIRLHSSSIKKRPSPFAMTRSSFQGRDAQRSRDNRDRSPSSSSSRSYKENRRSEQYREQEYEQSRYARSDSNKRLGKVDDNYRTAVGVSSSIRNNDNNNFSHKRTNNWSNSGDHRNSDSGDSRSSRNRDESIQSNRIGKILNSKSNNRAHDDFEREREQRSTRRGAKPFQSKEMLDVDMDDSQEIKLIQSSKNSATSFKSFTTKIKNTVTGQRTNIAVAASIPISLQNLPKVILQAGKARIFQEGNPIVYSGAISSIAPGASGSPPKCGDEVLVCDQHGNLFARGFYNDFSQYQVRIIHWASQSPSTPLSASLPKNAFEMPLEELLVEKLKHAKLLRESLGLPSSDSIDNTDAYRLVNSEGDTLSGLIVDVFQNVIVVHSSAYWVENSRELICKALHRVFESNPVKMTIQWKVATSRLKQDGFPIASHTTVESSDNIDKEERNSSSATSSLVISENGVKYGVNPEIDQKTGFYCDQRENRQLIRNLVAKRVSVSNDKLRVLDLFCYSGGFSMNAMLGGASEVIAVDSSLPALRNALQNSKLNGLQGQLFESWQSFHENPQQSLGIKFVASDCTDAMAAMLGSSDGNDNEKFDIVICDPPKLAPTRTSLEKAYHKYVQINAQAMQLVKFSTSGGGLLLTCTCSAAMTQSEEMGKTFHSMLMKAAKIANRQITVFRKVMQQEIMLCL